MKTVYKIYNFNIILSNSSSNKYPSFLFKHLKIIYILSYQNKFPSGFKTKSFSKWYKIKYHNTIISKICHLSRTRHNFSYGTYQIDNIQIFPSRSVKSFRTNIHKYFQSSYLFLSQSFKNHFQTTGISVLRITLFKNHLISNTLKQFQNNITLSEIYTFQVIHINR